jgi:hypothetical protein
MKIKISYQYRYYIMTKSHDKYIFVDMTDIPY